MNRIEELLIDRSTGDLTPEGEVELRQWLVQNPGGDAEAYERLAGEIAAALSSGESSAEPLPELLFQKVLADGEGSFAPAGHSPGASSGSLRPWRAWSGWIVAAAAAVGWFLALDRATPVVEPRVEPTLAEVREGLVDRSAALLAWTSTEDPSANAAAGDVVWSDVEQAGVMRIEGLAVNDPTASQYQLWIFDESRDERYPVDGGVFDIPAGDAEVLVPIRAAVPVSRASLFAVTVEQPGGVVVSDRERIVLVAQRS
ncbi:MAG: anti-sigma factor [Gemmatimonadetes bacterium]|nr:anti-sigma factor [Gemmatimonadota bacterium]